MYPDTRDDVTIPEGGPMPNHVPPLPVTDRDDLEPGDRVIVIDASDDLYNCEGDLVHVANGFATPTPMATVRMDQQPVGDDREQRFFLHQIAITASGRPA
jgi:hypothetical protein